MGDISVTKLAGHSLIVGPILALVYYFINARSSEHRRADQHQTFQGWVVSVYRRACRREVVMRRRDCPTTGLPCLSLDRFREPVWVKQRNPRRNEGLFLR